MICVRKREKKKMSETIFPNWPAGDFGAPVRSELIGDVLGRSGSLRYAREVIGARNRHDGKTQAPER